MNKTVKSLGVRSIQFIFINFTNTGDLIISSVRDPWTGQIAPYILPLDIQPNMTNLYTCVQLF